MTHKVLLISYAFPPLAAPEALLSAKLMGNLAGLECDVIATLPWKSHAQDKDLVVQGSRLWGIQEEGHRP